jgi:hypothetical protein
LFPSFQRAPPTVAQQSITERPATQAEDIAEYMREYATLGREFHQDMTLVEYCGLKLRNHPIEPQSNNSGINWISSGKLVNSPYLILTDLPNALLELGYKS